MPTMLAQEEIFINESILVSGNRYKMVFQRVNSIQIWGFDDLDGFSEQDMYAVGGAGDVWHYNGEIWIPLWFSL